MRDYASAAEQSEKALQYLTNLYVPDKTVAQVFYVLLTNEWSMLFDPYLQILLGFITLYTPISGICEGNRGRNVVIHICPQEFLKYIYFQSVRKLDRGQFSEFTCSFSKLKRDLFNGQRDCDAVSEVLLLTAIRISGIMPTSVCDGDYYVRWPE